VTKSRLPLQHRQLPVAYLTRFNFISFAGREQIHRVDTKRRSEPLQVVERDVGCASLNLAHVCPMETASVGQCLLRDFLLQAQPPEILSKPPSEVRREVVDFNIGHGQEVGATPPLRLPHKHLPYLYLLSIHLLFIRIQYKHLQIHFYYSIGVTRCHHGNSRSRWSSLMSI